MEIEQNDTTNILQLLLPSYVLWNLEDGATDFELIQDNVVIFFCEISNFDSILQNQKRNIISFIDEVYREFDRFCSNNDLIKIEVI